jgi:transposase
LPAAASLTQLVLDFLPWKTARRYRGAHENAVLDFADMPHEVLYDNMRMVVLERHGYGRGRHRFYAGFLDFARHCGFQPRLRAPRRAQITDVIDKRFLRRSR